MTVDSIEMIVDIDYILGWNGWRDNPENVL